MGRSMSAPPSPSTAPSRASPHAPAAPCTGLVLTGGGARAAYQVGVLQAISQLRREAGAPPAANPFQVFAGTSAGAINAAALACNADDFGGAVARMVQVWRNFTPQQVYSVDRLAALDVAGRWRMFYGLARLFNRWRRVQPHSMLDNTPLVGLLRRLVPLGRLPALMRAGHLQALAISASNYSSGQHCTFYDAATPMAPWARSQRVALAGRLRLRHLIASSAIPFLFPATGIRLEGHTEYFGDGSMRQSAPIAPAIHLGAQRILVIGAGRLHEAHEAPGPNTHTGYPTLAQVAGHALSSIFLDALGVDIERLQRINQTLLHVAPEALPNTGLRPIELLVLAPSERIDVIAARHTAALPGALRRMLDAQAEEAPTGPHSAVKAAALASYLLFDGGFTRELMALGREDTLGQRAEVLRFFGQVGG